MKERVEFINNNGNEPVGAALVVGAGIGGMQASLDLAESGIKVYLLDSAPAIGGTMAQLDKTFPTNDCAMCIVSPKLVEVGRHLNIEILTTAELLEVNGDPGHFKAKIRQKPRYVNLDACTSCGDCSAVCPIPRHDLFNESLSERKAIYKLYPQAIPNTFAIEKTGVAPCRDACPIHQRAQGYIALVAEGRFADAYRTIREDNPFPSVCGRVCNHVCEDACTRGDHDAPVNIMALKRFVTDWAMNNKDEIDLGSPVRPESSGKKVAIIGAGPAGLTCGLDLVREGHQATIFEVLPVAGGMMRVGVPGYRMPYDVLQEEIDEIVNEGVEIRLNSPVEDVPGLLKQGYDAVFVAVGAHKGVKLPIPGADSEKVLSGIQFLREVSLRLDDGKIEDGQEDETPNPVAGKRVLVLGGGNVAIDTAMTAVRMNAAWVGMACLESREKMPAHDWEVRDAEEEGIEVFPSRTFKEIVEKDGNLEGVRCVQVDFRGFVDGRPDFTEFPETEEMIRADIVMFATGQIPEINLLQDHVETIRGRFVKVDPDTMATSQPGIFAGGDAVTGTSFIVDGIAGGHRAAKSIHRYLNGEALHQEEPSPPAVEIDEHEMLHLLAGENVSQSDRSEMLSRPAEERKSDFSEVYAGLSEAQAIEEAKRCLSCGICSECLQCVYACQAAAIDHNQVEEIVELDVGAVLLTPGLEPVPADIRPEYGYGRYANVVTSLEFERMLSASGPFAGVVQRPSDAKHPHKVAWIQCVGSRDISCDQGYCSSVCCMYATKEAIIAREHDANIEPTIFYMDIRSFGKGFDAYIDRAKDEHGIRYMRSMVSAVKEIPGSKNLRLSYATFDADGKPITHEEEYEMVVLSLGLKPSQATQEMAQRLGLALNEYGFAEPEPYQTSQSSREGIYVAGAFSEPKDIPETVIEASCAAAKVSGALAAARGSQTREMVYPPERDVSAEEPRVGVFVCHCGINIGGVVDVPDVVDFAQNLPNVVHVERNLYTCSQDTQEKITQVVQEQKLNRVVVASCTPRTHEPLFQDTIRQAGLNPHLFELANIREQDAWVHRNEPEVATHKAKQLVSMATAKASRLRPLQRGTLNIEHSALVIGGGLAGMTAALSISEQGYPVYLVEKQDVLGGHLRHIKTGFDQTSPQQLLQETIKKVSQQPRITVMLESEVAEISGYVGQFQTLVQNRTGEKTELSHGVIVVASGGQETQPKSYGYNQYKNVITQHELEEDLQSRFAAGNTPESVVMIQCVGSRDEEHPYCSRICCSQAVKNALEIKRISPQTHITILYRDLRTYGFRERYYREARQAGVVFLEFDPEKAPLVSQADGRLNVNVISQPENDEIALKSDLVVLSAGIEAEPGNEKLSQLLKLPLTEEGFFFEAHVKLRPVDFAADGIFLCGLAHSPRSLDETMAQAQAASVRAVTLLAKKELTATPIIAQVNPRLCAACGVCVDVCPYDARRLEADMKHAEVVEVLCQGCGACVVACPNKATQQRGFEFLQVTSMLDAALMEL